MPDIILSTRVKALATRRRSVKAPTTADVPTINLAVARDSCLNVPARAFGGGIGEGLEKEKERQEYSPTQPKRRKLATALSRSCEMGLRRAKARRILSTMRCAVNTTPLSPTRSSIPSGNSEVWRDLAAERGAMARLDLALLDDIGQVFHDRSYTLHLQRLERRGVEQLTSVIEEIASRVRRDVARAPRDDSLPFLTTELELFDEIIGGYTRAFSVEKAVSASPAVCRSSRQT